jgi:indole-3-glycerol phosphate synthase
MGILDEIVRKKRERLSSVKSKTPIGEIRSKIQDMEKTRDFPQAIKKNGGRIRLIAEIKKASPSKGIIRKDFDPVKIASIYNERADAVSVLTEEDFFMGDLKHIKAVKRALSKPVLRKDFIFDEYQIYESRAEGADAILLIDGILEKSQSKEYLHIASELGLSVLYEIHDMGELENALFVNAGIIGVNNRNLDTLSVSLDTTFKIKKEIPEGKTVVSESGIRTNADVRRLDEAGIDAMLIGTAFMEAKDIGKKIEELRGA